MKNIKREFIDAYMTTDSCPICNSVNTQLNWEEAIYVDGYRIELTGSFYYCKLCGYFGLYVDSDDHDEWEPELGYGISLMKNPSKAVMQNFVLRKNYEKARGLELKDHTDYVPEIIPKAKIPFYDLDEIE